MEMDMSKADKLRAAQVAIEAARLTAEAKAKGLPEEPAVLRTGGGLIDG